MLQTFSRLRRVTLLSLQSCSLVDLVAVYGVSDTKYERSAGSSGGFTSPRSGCETSRNDGDVGLDPPLPTVRPELFIGLIMYNLAIIYAKNPYKIHQVD